MAHYERLANGKYAYTTTVQVVSLDDFTNKNRNIFSGTIACTRNNTSSDTNRTRYLFTLGGISNSSYGITNSNCGWIIGTSLNMTNIITTYEARTIGNNTYYGVRVYDSLGMVLTKTSAQGATNYMIFSPCTFTVTYIPNGTTNIVTKQVHFAGITQDPGTSKVTYGCYVGLGMTTGDFILSVIADTE